MYWNFFGETFGVLILVVFSIFGFLGFICFSCFLHRKLGKRHFEANGRWFLSRNNNNQINNNNINLNNNEINNLNKNNTPIIRHQALNQKNLPMINARNKQIRISDGCSKFIVNFDSIGLGNHWITCHPELRDIINENSNSLPPPIPANNPFENN